MSSCSVSLFNLSPPSTVSVFVESLNGFSLIVMRLGSSDMAGSALGTSFSLLLFASIIQGRQDFQVFHYEKMEAVVGQNVTLPCFVKSSTNLQIVSTEWSKNKNNNTKLAVFSKGHGTYLFWPNVTIQNMSMGSNLHLSNVAKWDSGTYICDITTFPLGSIRSETELKIKDADVEIMCDVNRTVEVHTGENVTIHCRAFPNTEYKWTKNKTLVSEKASLELCWVTDAHTGVYALNVTTGYKSLHREFTVTVLTATTSLRTDLVTVLPRSNITVEGLIGSTGRGLTTSPTNGLSTTDTNVKWAMSTGTDETEDPNPSNSTITAVQRPTHTSVTSSPAAFSDLYHSNNTSDLDPSHSLNTSTFSDQSVTSNLSTTLRYDSKVLRSTQETRNESMGTTEENYDNPSTTPAVATGNVVVSEDEDTDGVRSHLWLVLIIAPMLVLIVVAGILCRRKIIEQRMDLPPPFKPPPPPIKYTAARHREPFPTSRCNSITEFTDMGQKCTYI